MRVFLKEDPLQDVVKSFLTAHFPGEGIFFETRNPSGCDFVFDFQPGRTGLAYYKQGELIYEDLFGKEHPLIIEREGLKDTKSILKHNKRLAKYMIHKVAGNVIGRPLPWGILTGVRPTKLVYELIEKHGKKRAVIADILYNDYKIAKEKISLLLDVVGFDGEILEQLNSEGVHLYIGIPFCPSRCAYCSFTAYDVETYADQIGSYLGALEKEMTYVAKQLLKNRPILSVYVGGGTPTALNSLHFEQLLQKITDIFDLKNTVEFTVEAGRPDTINGFKLKLMRSYGVTRMSVNPQTMNQETLNVIGRNHTVEAAQDTFLLAQASGFDCVNLDLIVGLPGESRVHVLYTLEQLWKLNPDHVTVHTLSIKKGSKLKEDLQNYRMAEAEEIEEMLKMCRIQLELMGMKPYYMYRQKNTLGNFENIGFAKPGKHSLYNMVMIEEAQTVIAMGAGGISKIVVKDGNETVIHRVENVKQVDHYIANVDEMIERKHDHRKYL